MSADNQDSTGIFWVASYPRSGNTLVRVALSRILLPDDAQVHLDRNFPEFVNGRDIASGGRAFTASTGTVLFVKTHWHQPKDGLRSLGGVYLYRHPVDVFLSALNYMFMNCKSVPGFARYFRGDPRPVEELARRGELPIYLDRFVQDLGMTPMNYTSGSWIDNLNHWMERADKDPIILLKYDELIADLAGSMRTILASARIDVPAERFDRGILAAQAATKPNGGFFWRGSADTKREFFSEAQIRQAEDALYPRLSYPERLARCRENA